MEKTGKPSVWLILGIPIILLGILYLLLTAYYSGTFSLGTWINGVYCTGKSVEEVNQLLLADTILPEFQVTDQDGRTQKISLEKVECRIDYTLHLEQFMKQQNPFLWIARLLTGKNYTVQPSVSYNPEELVVQLEKLSVVKEGRAAKSPEVRIEKTKEGYVLFENLKNVPDADKIITHLLTEIEEGNQNIEISTDCYIEREPTAAMKETISLWEKVDALQSCNIVYDMGDVQVPIDASVVADWIAVDEEGNILIEDGQPVLKENCFKDFIEALATEFDTYNVPREFQTTAGETVVIEKGTYGNRLDRKKEEAYLKEAFLAGKSETHTPVYEQMALFQGKNDIGDTYIEVDITEQKMYYYKEGELRIDTPVVTGNVSSGHRTPSRVCYVYAKQTKRILRGPGYASPVDFWMPVYGSIGIHDATWRSEFGGEIYKTSGSHGCINTPYDTMKQLYEEVEIGTPVIIF